MPPTLNERAQRQADFLAANAGSYRIAVSQSESGARIIDCGVNVQGGLQSGLGLIRVCTAGLADITLVQGEVAGVASPYIQIMSDQPVTACMAAQYAGWPISVDKFSAMGSGPMRAVRGKEELFNDIKGKETSPVAVGVLESRKLPDETVLAGLSQELNLPANKLTFLVAPAASLSGTMQVVGRSLETALHKLHELKFDLKQIVSGFGSAPLPPVGTNELDAIGKTNDAILYAGRVVLWVNSEDDYLRELGPKVPSNSSPDFGAPFKEIFARYNQDFYQIDPVLFSPAEVVFHNLKSGKSHVFGKVAPDVARKSFFEGN